MTVFGPEGLEIHWGLPIAVFVRRVVKKSGWWTHTGR